MPEHRVGKPGLSALQRRTGERALIRRTERLGRAQPRARRLGQPFVGGTYTVAQVAPPYTNGLRNIAYHGTNALVLIESLAPNNDTGTIFTTGFTTQSKHNDASRLVALLSSCAVLAACGGGGGGGAMPSAKTAAGAGGGGNGTLAYSIAVPGRGSSALTRRTPKYVSASTTQAVVVVTPQGGVPATQTVSCTATCSGSLSIPAGLANVQMALEDSNNRVLSQGSTPVLIVAGQTNSIRFTLDGVVNSVSLQFVPPFVTSVASTTVFVLVNALDADNDVITYNGAYVDANDTQVTIKLTSADNTVNAALASYAISAPGAVIPVPYSGQLGFTVTPSVTSGNVPGTIAGASFRPHVPLLAFNILNGSVTKLLLPPYNGSQIGVGNGLAGTTALAMDAAGDLFVASDFITQAVDIYAPPYGGSPTVISSGLNGPSALALDTTGNLFVANTNGNTVTIYAPPYTGSPSTVSSGVSGPDALALDATGNLFVANGSGNTVTVYAPPYTGAPTVTISSGVQGPRALLLTPQAAFSWRTPVQTP